MAAAAASAQLAPAAGVSIKPSNRQAAQLVYQAQIALQRKNPDDAEKLLDSAKALNDEELRLWSTYGYLALARGDKPAAEADFRKELAMHPQATEIYSALLDLEDSLDQRAEEEATLTAWTGSDPRAAGAAARLVHLLVEDGKPADAVKLGQDALARFSEALKTAPRLNPHAADLLNYEICKAELAAGSKDDAIAGLVALLKTTNIPLIQNDGAYRLAVAGVELPLAESKARGVLLRAELDSRRITLDSPKTIQRQVLDGVFAVWETLALILFRENKLEEAESYARSAWLQQQDLTVGSHLAQIEAAKGDKNLALTVCEISLAADKASVKPVKDPKKTPVKVPEVRPGEVDAPALQAQAETLRKAGAVSKGPGMLDAMLTQPVAPIRGTTGRGEFIVMMGFGIVQLANPASNANATGMLSGLLGMKVTGLWPKDSGARLIMKATVTCRPGGCTLQLHDLDPPPPATPPPVATPPAATPPPATATPPAAR